MPSYLEEVDYDQDTEGKYAQIADAMLDQVSYDLILHTFFAFQLAVQSQTGCHRPCDAPKYETVVVQEADSPELSVEEAGVFAGEEGEEEKIWRRFFGAR